MLHPALPSHPQHAAWQRDFTGACGLFAFVLDGGISQAAVDACVDGLSLFGIGASWGGHESLIAQRTPKRAFAKPVAGHWLRVYVGLEDADDLIADMEAGFGRMRGKRGK